MINDNFEWLAKWYAAQCNNDWEHSYGVKIDTLDNPGWNLRIDLADTDLDGKPFESVTRGEIASDLEEWKQSSGWLVASRHGLVFEVNCGPFDLSEAIGVFRSWAEPGE